MKPDHPYQQMLLDSELGVYCCAVEGCLALAIDHPPDPPEKLKKFRELIRQLLAEGVKPTPSEFAKRGWPYVTVANDRHYYRHGGGNPVAVPGSGTTWSHGRYAQARREELKRAGWTLKPNRGFGVWIPPS